MVPQPPPPPGDCSHPWLVVFSALPVLVTLVAFWLKKSIRLPALTILSRLSPIYVSGALCVWTMLVCPYSDAAWALIPVLLSPLLMFGAHFRLSFVDTLSATAQFIYFLAHMVIFVPLWWICFLLIAREGP